MEIPYSIVIPYFQILSWYFSLDDLASPPLRAFVALRNEQAVFHGALQFKWPFLDCSFIAG
jgi:hypothetical protein